MQKYNSMLLYVQHVWYTRFLENQNAFVEEKTKFYSKRQRVDTFKWKKSKEKRQRINYRSNMKDAKAMRHKNSRKSKLPVWNKNKRGHKKTKFWSRTKPVQVLRRGLSCYTNTAHEF